MIGIEHSVLGVVCHSCMVVDKLISNYYMLFQYFQRLTRK